MALRHELLVSTVFAALAVGARDNHFLAQLLSRVNTNHPVKVSTHMRLVELVFEFAGLKFCKLELTCSVFIIISYVVHLWEVSGFESSSSSQLEVPKLGTTEADLVVAAFMQILGDVMAKVFHSHLILAVGERRQILAEATGAFPSLESRGQFRDIKKFNFLVIILTDGLFFVTPILIV